MAIIWKIRLRDHFHFETAVLFNNNENIVGCFRFGTGVEHGEGVVSKPETNVASALDCQRWCQKNPNCTFFNWNPTNRNCFLRSHLTHGEDSLKKNVFASLIGTRDCNDVKIIWPEIYPPEQEARNSQDDVQVITSPPIPIPLSTLTPTPAAPLNSFDGGLEGSIVPLNPSNSRSPGEIQASDVAKCEQR